MDDSEILPEFNNSGYCNRSLETELADSGGNPITILPDRGSIVIPVISTSFNVALNRPPIVIDCGGSAIRPSTIDNGDCNRSLDTELADRGAGSIDITKLLVSGLTDRFVTSTPLLVALNPYPIVIDDVGSVIRPSITDNGYCNRSLDIEFADNGGRDITRLLDSELTAILVISAPSEDAFRGPLTVIVLVETVFIGMVADNVILPESSIIGAMTRSVDTELADRGDSSNELVGDMEMCGLPDEYTPPMISQLDRCGAYECFNRCNVLVSDAYAKSPTIAVEKLFGIVVLVGCTIFPATFPPLNTLSPINNRLVSAAYTGSPDENTNFFLSESSPWRNISFRIVFWNSCIYY